jgi:hypothetical protein
VGHLFQGRFQAILVEQEGYQNEKWGQEREMGSENNFVDSQPAAK